MQPLTTGGKTGFHRPQLLALLLVLLAGAAFLWYSVRTHPVIHSKVAVLNSRKPMNVLVGVQGTPLNPGFVGFVAEVKPGSRILLVIPISGQIQVNTGAAQEPLYRLVSEMPAHSTMQLVARSTGLPIDHYFYLNANNLFKLLDALYYHSPHWPARNTPLTMLKTLGYPGKRVHPKEDMALVRKIVNRLPLISPLAATSLLSIPQTSVTNLTSYQLFLLANYVRGDEIKQGVLHPHRPQRGSHG